MKSKSILGLSNNFWWFASKNYRHNSPEEPEAGKWPAFPLWTTEQDYTRKIGGAARMWWHFRYWTCLFQEEAPSLIQVTGNNQFGCNLQQKQGKRAVKPMTHWIYLLTKAHKVYDATGWKFLDVVLAVQLIQFFLKALNVNIGGSHDDF